MPNMNASPQQIQAAASAGVALLSSKDLLVPVNLALGGQLGTLQALLSSIANGDLIVVPMPQSTKREEPNLTPITGGKQEDGSEGEMG